MEDRVERGGKDGERYRVGSRGLDVHREEEN